MSWYARSVAPGDVHRGVEDEGRVRAACGLEFLPARGESGRTRCGKLPAPDRVCPECLAWTTDHAAIPATCARSPEEVISLVMRDLSDGRITLQSPTDGGCTLTVHAAHVFDILGQWLG